ncbi:ABC transporter ATP-binding protein [Alkaliphilus peptidifermentans]|uniref:Oligopeptide transport system ATP-binding protein n=1 Tax=Alkaliphilus peptidifermentans DSM 18978 TaxID=1120976 RepID=A0A1G5AY42_9FIRM|nr:oligopeptide/dipeptide ABC transporter ATP-binding protein [Alkaliphilus peptidifermentans]SCX82787.1 oligopeptide transport system ATP-binding protein [Alkaliphilus peptidifermentans DSM 18978]
MSKEKLVEIINLKKYFHVGRNEVLKAVDDVTFEIRRGETLGLVGESGCGKTTCGRTILGIYNSTDGQVLYNGQNVHKMSSSEKVKFKKGAQIIFQDPYASLDPRMTIGEIIAEGIDVHFKLKESERIARIDDLLEKVGMNSDFRSRFPHELSGGQRQRIGIARALAVEPDFIVCDEPISALDVSIQAQIVNLLIKLQNQLGLTYLFIAHDLSMVKHISDRVGVMYLGSLVEITESQELYRKPLHPYTKSLISAIPIPDPKVEEERQRIKLEGEVPSPINTPPGCKFVKRCSYAMDICGKVSPELKEVEKDHFVACHLYK